MPDQFDPYSQWLGIVAPQRPVNYYVLLGIAPSESDQQKIAQAADMLAARVRRIRPGPYLAQWSALLDEIAAAKACLTDPAARRAYDASLAQQIAAQQGVTAQAGDAGAIAGVAVAHRQAAFGQLAQPFASAEPREASAADQRHGLGVQYPAGADRPPAAPPQPSAGQTFAGNPTNSQLFGHIEQREFPETSAVYQPNSQPGAMTASAGQPGAAPPGQPLADAPLWRQPSEDAGPVRAPFAVGYTQAPVYVTTPQPTPPPFVIPGQSPPVWPAAGTMAGGYVPGHPAEAPPFPAAQTNEPDLTATHSAVVPLNTVGQSTQSPPRGSGLRVIAGVLLVVLIALLCATVYELLKRNGMLVAGGAQNARTSDASNNGYAGANGGDGQGRSMQTGQTTVAQSTAGQSSSNGQHTQENKTNRGQTDQHSGNNGVDANNGISGSNSPKPPSQQTGENNGKSPVGGNNPEKPQPGAQQPPSDDPQKRAAFLGAVEKAKLAMQDRDLAAARTHLKDAAGYAQNDADRDRLVRVETLLASLEEFWNALREAVAKLPAPGDLKVRDTYVAVVDNSHHGIIVRAAGRNLSYRIEEMPLTLILAIVEHSFRKTADTKVLLGTFLGIEPRADRAEARRLLQEAARSGRNVDAILSELNLASAPASGGSSSQSAGSSGDLTSRVEALMQRASSAKNSAEHRDAAVAALTLLEQAVKEKKFEEARRLAELALTAARASNNPTLMRQAAAAKQSLTNLPER